MNHWSIAQLLTSLFVGNVCPQPNIVIAVYSVKDTLLSLAIIYVYRYLNKVNVSKCDIYYYTYLLENSNGGSSLLNNAIAKGFSNKIGPLPPKKEWYNVLISDDKGQL